MEKLVNSHIVIIYFPSFAPPPLPPIITIYNVYFGRVPFNTYLPTDLLYVYPRRTVVTNDL